MKKISLLSLILSAGCMDWITVIPDDFVVAEAGPASVDTGSRCGLDEDGDGHVNCDESGTVVDCDDTNPRINPAAVETCDDGIDNNCNGLIDEGCQAPQDAGPAPQDSGSAAVDSGQVTPGQPGAYQRNAPCYEDPYSEAMTVCMRFNGDVINERSLQVEQFSQQAQEYETLLGENQAFNFSVDNYLRVVPDQADLYTAAFTLTAWVKPNRVNLNEGPFTIFSSQFTDNLGESQGPFRLEIEDGKPKVMWTDVGGGPPHTLYAFDGTDRTLPTDRYTHLMVVFGLELDDYEMRLYMDGELSAFAGQTDPLSSRNMELDPRDGIGGHFNYNGDGETPFAFSPFQGAIDDLRIWNKAHLADFLAFEAGRFVERFADAFAVGQLNCGAAFNEVAGSYVARLTETCTIRAFPTPQRVQRIKFRVGVAEPVGTPPVGNGPSLEFIGDDTRFRVLRFEDQNGTPTFAIETNEELGPLTVAGCDVPNSGGAAPEMVLSFDWSNRELELACGESRTVVPLPAGMQGLDSLRVNPGNLVGSRFWIDDIVWEL